MKNKILLCTVAGALFAGGVTVNQVFAANGPSASARAPGRGGILQRIAEKLNLSADQRAQIKTILAGEKDTLTPLLTAVHDARKDLRAAIRAGDASETSVRAASAKVASAEADLAVERMKIFGKIAPILTDAQKQQLGELQQRADDFLDRAITRLGLVLGD